LEHRVSILKCEEVRNTHFPTSCRTQSDDIAVLEKSGAIGSIRDMKSAWEARAEDERWAIRRSGVLIAVNVSQERFSQAGRVRLQRSACWECRTKKACRITWYGWLSSYHWSVLPLCFFLRIDDALGFASTNKAACRHLLRNISGVRAFFFELGGYILQRWAVARGINLLIFKSSSSGAQASNTLRTKEGLTGNEIVFSSPSGCLRKPDSNGWVAWQNLETAAVHWQVVALLSPAPGTFAADKKKLRSATSCQRRWPNACAININSTNRNGKSFLFWSFRCNFDKKGENPQAWLTRLVLLIR